MASAIPITEDEFRERTVSKYREHFNHVFSLSEFAQDAMGSYKGQRRSAYDVCLTLILPAQAHLNAAGLFTMAGFVITDLAPDDQQKAIMDRNFERYRSRQFCRSLATVLAISSEIDSFWKLNNRETLSRLLVLLGGYAPEADDLYRLRYRVMLT